MVSKAAKIKVQDNSSLEPLKKDTKGGAIANITLTKPVEFDQPTQFDAKRINPMPERCNQGKLFNAEDYKTHIEKAFTNTSNKTLGSVCKEVASDAKDIFQSCGDTSKYTFSAAIMPRCYV